MTPAERNAIGRRQAEAVFEAICPEVLGNPLLPQWPLANQALLLGAHLRPRASKGRVYQCLYGGQAGGGKSAALLLAGAQFAWKHPSYAGIIFRRSFTELAQPDAIMDRAISWWGRHPMAHWDGTNKTVRFASGARLVFSYLQRPLDHLVYQGARYDFTGWDELTQWPSGKQYEYVGISRVRRAADSVVPLRTLSTSNPGGPGHDWVRAKFIGGVDPATGRFTKAKHDYIPAKLTDNFYLDRDSYIAGMQELHPTVRAQLLEGDWSAREPGDYFRLEWFGPMLDPETERWPASECVRIRWWDLAASEKEENARTASIRMARHRSGVRAIEHGCAFRLTPGSRDDRIAQVAAQDGYGVIIGLEIEPGSGGIAQVEALEKRLRGMGYRVVSARPGSMTDPESVVMLRQQRAESAKATRADPVASCLERGYQRRGEGRDTGGPWWGQDKDLGAQAQRDGIRCFAGPWVPDFMSEIEGFPDGPRCDYVDAMSGAWAWLEVHAPGLLIAPNLTNRKAAVHNPHDVHPEDREEPDASVRKSWLR